MMSLAIRTRVESSYRQAKFSPRDEPVQRRTHLREEPVAASHRAYFLDELNADSTPLPKRRGGATHPPNPIGFGRHSAAPVDKVAYEEATHLGWHTYRYHDAPTYYIPTNLLDDEIPSNMNDSRSASTWYHFQGSAAPSHARSQRTGGMDDCYSFGDQLWSASTWWHFEGPAQPSDALPHDLEPSLPGDLFAACPPHIAVPRSEISVPPDFSLQSPSPPTSHADGSLWCAGSSQSWSSTEDPTSMNSSTTSSPSLPIPCSHPKPPTGSHLPRGRKHYGPFEACSREDVLYADSSDAGTEAPWQDREARFAALRALAEWTPEDRIAEQPVQPTEEGNGWSLKEMEAYMMRVRNRLLAAWHTHPAPREPSRAQRDPCPVIVHARPVHFDMVVNTIVAGLETQCEWISLEIRGIIQKYVLALFVLESHFFRHSVSRVQGSDIWATEMPWRLTSQSRGASRNAVMHRDFRRGVASKREGSGGSRGLGPEKPGVNALNAVQSLGVVVAADYCLAITVCKDFRSDFCGLGYGENGIYDGVRHPLPFRAQECEL
ncbi:hypothetical protein DFH07DRAFT_936844 [Mycena maculata]|uniref:Uncharacterized protein n=1 Tax=Mycena maculata TaxID=230809 RepID=A0AAD7K6B1_9AGAR|nr:hypothetical protein DFH07DRAFT_936844 [Mycena maculata]